MPPKPQTVDWRARSLIILFVVISGVNAPSQVAPSVTLAWDANAERVGGYVVYVGTQSGDYVEDHDVGNRTTFTYRKPVANRRYYFAVLAYSTDGESSLLSQEVFSDGDAEEPPRPPEEIDILKSQPLFPAAKVAPDCADTERCYTISNRAAGLQSITAMAATADGRLFVVENARHIRLVAHDDVLGAPALSAAEDAVITDLVIDPAFETTGRVFVGVMQPTSRGGWEFSVLRSRWLEGRSAETAVVITGLPVSSGGRPRLAIDRAAHIYIAMPGPSETRADVYAGRILRLNDDGTVAAGNRAGSPVLAFGFDDPAGLATDGRHLWAGGFDARSPHALARLPLDAPVVDEWPRVLDPLTIANADASTATPHVLAVAVSPRGASDEDQVLAYIDTAHQLFVIHLASGTVQRRDDLSVAFRDLVPQALAVGPARQIYVAARAADGSSSIVELVAPRK